MASPTSHVPAVASILLVVALAGTASAAPPAAGSIAFRGQVPWQAGLFKSAVSADNLLGSGALVSQRFIITSASAVHGVDASKEKVLALLGGLSLSQTSEKGRQHLQVQTTTLHEGWNAATAENDIALLQLIGDVIETDVIQPIRLPPRYARGATFAGTTVTVSGWGGANQVESVPDLLTLSNLDVIRNMECQQFQGNPAVRLPWTKMCIKGASGAGPCKGDSGDPAVFLENDGIYTLVGVLSSDVQCSTDKPTTLARITEHLDWIEANSDVRIS